MSFASSLQAVAQSLLSTYGRSVTMTRVTEGEYDPQTSGVTTTSSTTYTGYGHPSPYSVAEIAGAGVLATDIKLMFYGTTTPLVGDTASIDSASYRIMNVQKISAQGSNIIYTLQLRN